MSTGSGLLQKARKSILDWIELGIVVMSVILYYILHVVTGPLPAAIIAIGAGMVCLFMYTRHLPFRSAVHKWQ